MDNSNNSQNFSASPTTNDINAANQAAQNPPVAGMTPTPTWLPPQPAAAATPPNPFSTPQAPAPTAPDPTAWPSTPQDHGSASPTTGWTPAPPSTPDPAALSPMNSPAGNSFGNSTLTTPQPETPSPAWNPAPTDQSMPVPPTASPISTTPAWTPPAPSAPVPDANAFSTTPPMTAAPAAPAWTPPAAMPEPPGTPAAAEVAPMAPAASPPASVFPPQFQQPSTPTSNASFDPLATAPSSPAWPTPPTASNGFATPQPPLAQTPTPAFAPPMENSLPATDPTANSYTAAPPAAPTAPDFTNSQPPTGGAPDQSTSAFSTPSSAMNTNPTDLSGVGGSNNSPYSPMTGQDPTNAFGTTPSPATAPTSPSGIPETVANVNKPRLSKMLIIIGVIAILMVIASASYLLFLGPKPGTPEDTISLPVSGQAPLTKPKAIATPAPEEPVVAATSSASTPEASPSGSSAFDLLKKAKTASPSPSASPK